MTDYNNNINQEIKSRFINREVLMNCGIVMQELQKLEQYWFDSWDIDNLYHAPCPECGGDMKETDELQTNKDGIGYICDSCNYKSDEEPEQGIQEIMEYWFITSFLAEKLKEKGEVIINDFDSPIWGRGCTGQSILLDGVISHICEDMEVLEGQRNDWSK